MHVFYIIIGNKFLFILLTFRFELLFLLQAILEFFKKFTDSVGPDLQFVIDDISEEDSSAVGVTWHLGTRSLYSILYLFLLRLLAWWLNLLQNGREGLFLLAKDVAFIGWKQ